MTEVPETKFATLGEDRIAYQLFGRGEVDLLVLNGSGDCIDVRWDWPGYASYLYWLGGRARVISFDRRGTGASDAPTGEMLPSWELWADDARAVLDAVGAERAVLYGLADAGPAAILFAAVHPSRTNGLILVDSSARFGAAQDYSAGLSEQAVTDISQLVQSMWGTEAMGAFTAPDLASRSPEFSKWFAKNQRLYMSPREAAKVLTLEEAWDVREALPLVGVPTLVLHDEGFEPISADHGRYLADHIAGARLALLPGRDVCVFEPKDEVHGHLEEFLGGLTRVPDSDRALAAILFTDIVGSTEQAMAMGDREWRNLLESHDAVSRTLISQHRGRFVKMTGDGVLATFDGPGRAIRCAFALRDSLRPFGIEIRAGLHTGEVELRGEDIGGVGVHIAARVLDQAGAGELLASAAVPLLVAGSGIQFEDRGEHELKGVGAVRLYTVEG